MEGLIFGILRHPSRVFVYSFIYLFIYLFILRLSNQELLGIHQKTQLIFHSAILK